MAAPTLMTATPPASLASRSAASPDPSRVGGLDLGLSCDTRVDVILAAAAVDDHGLVLADHDAPGGAEHLEADLAQQQNPTSGLTTWPPVTTARIIQERLAAVAEEGAL